MTSNRERTWTGSREASQTDGPELGPDLVSELDVSG